MMNIILFLQKSNPTSKDSTKLTRTYSKNTAVKIWGDISMNMVRLLAVKIKRSIPANYHNHPLPEPQGSPCIVSTFNIPNIIPRI